VKGTKLWQEAGSPVIQGQSRYRRPFLNVWVRSALLASATLLGVTIALLVFPGEQAAPLALAVPIALTALVYALPGIAGGSLIGTAFGRVIGSRKAEYFGGLTGLILGLVSLGMLASDLTLRGITLS